MSQQWYTLIGGRTRGPIDNRVLKALADNGQLKPTDQVRRGESGQWVNARQVAGLFQAQPAPEADSGISVSSTSSAATKPTKDSTQDIDVAAVPPPPPTPAKQAPQPSAQIPTEAAPTTVNQQPPARFPVLQSLAMIFKVLAFLVLVGGVIVTLMIISSPNLNALAAFVSLGVTFFTSFLLFANGEFLLVVLKIEVQTEKTHELISSLAAVKVSEH